MKTGARGLGARTGDRGLDKGTGVRAPDNPNTLEKCCVSHLLEHSETDIESCSVKQLFGKM